MSQHAAVTLGSVLSRSNERTSPLPDESYKEITVKLWGKGVVLRRVVDGGEIVGQKRFVARAGQAILSRIDARNGAMGIVPPELDGALVTNDFPLFNIDEKRLDPSYFNWLSKTQNFVNLCIAASEGTTNRVRLQETRFVDLKIPLPPLAEQRRIVARIEQVAPKVAQARALREGASRAAAEFETALFNHIIRRGGFSSKKLGELVEKRTGVAYRAADFSQAGDVPVVKLQDIQTMAPRVFLTNPEDYTNVWLEKGDIVLAKTSFSTGAMCAWDGPRSVLNQNAVRLRASPEIMQPYLFAWLKQHISRYLKGHLADPNFYPYIREADLVEWDVPLPSLDEQAAIVREMAAMIERLARVTVLQNRVLRAVDAIVPAFVAAATVPRSD